jgi:hypothetical protein
MRACQTRKLRRILIIPWPKMSQGTSGDLVTIGDGKTK